MLLQVCVPRKGVLKGTSCLLCAVRARQGVEALLEEGLMKKEVEGVFSFPMFQGSFCDKFLEEVDKYFATGLPIRRPNSMNNYGLIVYEIGLEPAITQLQQTRILPIAKLLYPKQGFALNAQHSFMVEYKAGHDLGLDMHTGVSRALARTRTLS